jgi:hypothetical protein
VAYSWIANRPTGGFKSQLSMPYGLLLTIGNETAWGVRRVGGYTLFAEDLPGDGSADPGTGDFKHSDNKTKPPWRWTAKLQFRPRAMLRAADTLWLAGMPEAKGGADPATFTGADGGVLVAFSAADGQKQHQMAVPAAPVWDGMAVAGGKLVITTVDGRVLCLGQ